jgi:hypothetical protein
MKASQASRRSQDTMDSLTLQIFIHTGIGFVRGATPKLGLYD